MIASFLAFTRMKDHGRLRSFLSPAKGEAILRARAEKALTLCRLQESSGKARRRIVLWRGKDAWRRDGDDVRAGAVAAG